MPRDADMSGGVVNAQLKAANKRGCRDLILATKDTSLTMVANAKTDALPKRDLHLAWKKLEKRWDPKSREDKIDSITKFSQLKMENTQMKPKEWMAHMERKRNDLENAGHEMRDMKFLPSKADPCIWLRKAPNLRCYEYIALYVDDLCIAAESPSAIIQIFNSKYHLKVKGDGKLTYHLGADYFEDPDGTFVSQPKK